MSTDQKKTHDPEVCRGMCLLQSADSDGYEKSPEVNPCKPQSCPDCGTYVPQWILDGNKGSCIGCATLRVAGWKGPGYCEHCRSSRRLPVIGRARRNGSDHHDDWNSRKYHKACWKQVKEDDE